jgi:hypothetical protein
MLWLFLLVLILGLVFGWHVAAVLLVLRAGLKDLNRTISGVSA